LNRFNHWLEWELKMTAIVSTYRINAARRRARATGTTWLDWLRHRMAAASNQRQLRRNFKNLEPRLLEDAGVDPAEIHGEFWRHDERQRRRMDRTKLILIPWR
jgi:uncharacterized protein YjiS (DUF1127 family)